MDAVWWYYNYRYSETGMISSDIEECYKVMKRDGMNMNSVRKKIERNGEYDVDFSYGKYVSGRLKRIPFHGELYRGVYILRYPLAAYADKYRAYEDGVKFVIQNNPKYYWSKHNDFNTQTMTECNDAWYMEVTGKSYHNLTPKDWKLIYEARVNQDEYSEKNHIEFTKIK
jgi:hypothetical protein